MRKNGTFPKEEAARKLLSRMEALRTDLERPVLTTAVGVIKNGEILFSDAVGVKRLGEEADGNTRFRIASISKLVTAVGVWQLIEEGKLDPDADASGYLGFRLRNPAYPETPITVKMLLSHTSSIREGGGKPGSYNIPCGHHISEFFTPGMEYHNPHCWAAPGQAPGEFFAYCNMNYCLLGTVVENVSGQRFDRYMAEHVFAPMGLKCSYHVSAMPEEVKASVGTLYRKLDGAGWTAQADDFTNGYPHEQYADYVIGSNGSLFGPMGSLRISVNELCRIMVMLCSGGAYNGARILKPETVGRMFTPVWTYDPERKNGDNYGGLMNCYGMGPHIFTNTDKGDRMVPGQDLPFAGHTAEAYGLIGGMGFDRERGNGIVYFVAGLGCDTALCAGRYSMFYHWEEELLTAAAEFAEFDYRV